MLRRRQIAAEPGVWSRVFPAALKTWRDPSNLRRVWREVLAGLELDGFANHAMRKTVATFLDDADVSPRKITDQLSHAKASMTQDVHLGRKLTDRQTVDAPEGLFGSSKRVP